MMYILFTFLHHLFLSSINISRRNTLILLLMTVNTYSIMRGMDMRMGEVDVFPCVSRSASLSLALCRECNHDRLAPSSAHSQKRAKQKIVLDIVMRKIYF